MVGDEGGVPVKDVGRVRVRMRVRVGVRVRVWVRMRASEGGN